MLRFSPAFEVQTGGPTYVQSTRAGAVLIVQRTSSDLRLNPHVHAVFLDGVHHEGAGGEVAIYALPGLETEEVAHVLEDATRRITRYLERRGLLRGTTTRPRGALTAPEGEEARALAELAATSASGMTPPAGPAWKRGALPPGHDRTSTVTCRSGAAASLCTR